MNHPVAIQCEPVNLLPGPVAIHPRVKAAFMATPVSHRSDQFIDEMASLRSRLLRLVGAARVSVLVGTGTLANDAVAAILGERRQRGLIISTGEFGDRLVDHARRWNLAFDKLERPWGCAPDYHAIERQFASNPDLRWLWIVHCETSTGVLADLDRLKNMCARHDVDLCVDAVSSIGTVPVDFAGVYLATGTSSKGLASYAGLALLFSCDTPMESERIPRYLDPGQYEAHAGIPYTHSSNLVRALAAAIDRFDHDGRASVYFRRKSARCDWLRAELEARGFGVMAPHEIASPAVLTIALPEDRSAFSLGRALDLEGIHLSYRSAYLAERNMFQICLMGECAEDKLQRLLDRLDRHKRTPPRSPS